MAVLGRVNAGLRLADGLRWSVLGKNIIEKMCKKAGCGEAPQAGANMASAIFGGILVLEGQDCFSGYLGNYFSDYFRTTFRTFSDYA